MEYDGFDSIDFIPCYVNRRRIAALIGGKRLAFHAELERPVGMYSEMRFHAELAIFKDELLNWLLKNEKLVEPLDKLIASGRANPGQHFWAYRDFYGRGLRKKTGQPELHAIFEFEDKIKLQLLLDRSHVAPGSPADRLTGHPSNLFVFATIESTDTGLIVARPTFIGDLIKKGEELPFAPPYWFSRGEIQPSSIDSFSRIQTEKIPRTNELEKLWKIPEAEIKQTLCDIIGEPTIPKDWGGERSDVFTTHLRVDGREVSSAFLLKGPAGIEKPSAMTARHLGKRGDQIVRLFTEPADLLVLQYCHSVTAPVRKTMQAFAMSEHKTFCIIDGFNTMRILRAYGKCGFVSKPMNPPQPQPPPFGIHSEAKPNGVDEG
jgi:hypothetical protein